MCVFAGDTSVNRGFRPVIKLHDNNENKNNRSGNFSLLTMVKSRCSFTLGQLGWWRNGRLYFKTTHCFFNHELNVSPSGSHLQLHHLPVVHRFLHLLLLLPMNPLPTTSSSHPLLYLLLHFLFLLFLLHLPPASPSTSSLLYPSPRISFLHLSLLCFLLSLPLLHHLLPAYIHILSRY